MLGQCRENYVIVVYYVVTSKLNVFIEKHSLPAGAFSEQVSLSQVC